MTTKKEESKELAVQGNYEVSADLAKEFEGMGLGAGANVDNEDIIVPKIQLCQQLSEAVKEKLADAGDFINSVDKNVLAAKGENLDMIVMQNYKVWRCFEVKKGKKEYTETIDYVGNEGLAIDEEIGGVTIHRDKVLGFYVLLVDEIKQGMAFPYIVDFTRSSARSGKQLQTYFAKLRSVGLPSFAKVFTLSSKFITGEHDYFVKEVSAGRNIETSEAQAVKLWLDNIAANKDRMKEDDSDLRNNDDDIIDTEVSSNKF